MAEKITPTPAQVKALRESFGTQSACAVAVHSDIRTWQKWESGESKMHPAFWELANIKLRKNNGKNKNWGQNWTMESEK